jgi:thiamine-phosphate pyrophosphorylase
MDDRRPRLMLFSPPIADAAAFAAPLREALAESDVAAVAIAFAEADERTLVNMLKTLAPIVQAKEAAALVVDRPEIVARGGADGAHMGQRASLVPALGRLKEQERIVGAGGLALRDDAMSAAEAGADYVLFGDALADGRRPPIESVIERASWWAGIFETPCVAFASNLEALPELAATGAEFVALGDAVWAHAQGPRAAVAMAQRLLSQSLVA